MEEVAPRLTYAMHELWAHPVVHHLEETPLSARARYLVEGGLPEGRVIIGCFQQRAEVDDGNVGMGGEGGEGRTVRRVLDVAVGEDVNATVG